MPSVECLKGVQHDHRITSPCEEATTRQQDCARLGGAEDRGLSTAPRRCVVDRRDDLSVIPACGFRIGARGRSHELWRSGPSRNRTETRASGPLEHAGGCRS